MPGPATVSQTPPKRSEPEALQNVLATVGAFPKPFGPDPKLRDTLRPELHFILWLPRRHSYE